MLLTLIIDTVLHEGNLLKKFIEAKELNVSEIAGNTGISRGTFYNLFKSEELPREYLKILKDNIGFSLTEEDVYKNKQVGVQHKKQYGIPYYGDINAFGGNMNVFNGEHPELVTDIINIPSFNDCDCYINVSGESMYPIYSSGDIIALKRIQDKEVIQYGEAYVLITKENRMLKYIRKGKDERHWRLVSENKEHDAFEIDKNKVLTLFLVKGKIKKNVL